MTGDEDRKCILCCFSNVLSWIGEREGEASDDGEVGLVCVCVGLE